jgi:hypothetical protein
LVSGALAIFSAAIYQVTIGRVVFGKAKRETNTNPVFRKSVGDYSGSAVVLLSPMIVGFGTNVLMKLTNFTWEGCEEKWKVGAGFHLAVWLFVVVPRIVVEFAVFRISSRVFVSWIFASFVQAFVAGAASASLISDSA